MIKKTGQNKGEECFDRTSVWADPQGRHVSTNWDIKSEHGSDLYFLPQFWSIHNISCFTEYSHCTTPRLAASHCCNHARYSHCVLTFSRSDERSECSSDSSEWCILYANPWRNLWASFQFCRREENDRALKWMVQSKIYVFESRMRNIF